LKELKVIRLKDMSEMREMTSVIVSEIKREFSERENDIEARFLRSLIFASESKSKNIDVLFLYSAEVSSFCLIDVREEVRDGLLEAKDIVE
jgi:hypothetical protein